MWFRLQWHSLLDSGLRSLHLLLRIQVCLLHAQECILVVLRQPHRLAISRLRSKVRCIDLSQDVQRTFVPPPHFRRTNEGS